ncbi:ABC transporter ATP-binding protein [Paenibacillus larvae]|uniref:ABC transporter ATP-binding protein n=1 Tax=Paenibacillus larvae TaxID=1464 RepID=UPI002E1596B5
MLTFDYSRLECSHNYYFKNTCMERLENKMICVEKVSFQYENCISKAVDSLSFSLREGEILGLLGHNGAGKSTLLECLSGLRKPTEGQITADQIPVDQYKKISFIPNDLYLYNLLTVEETFLYIGRLHSLSYDQIREIADPLMEMFSLQDKRKEYVKHLSFGMKQKVALILGILDSPRYLLLDEPMTGYDPLSTKTTKEFLLHLAGEQRTGILLSSHRLDIVEDLCDRVLVIHQGVLLFDGSISSLKHDRSFEEALVSLMQGDEHEASQ